MKTYPPQLSNPVTVDLRTSLASGRRLTKILAMAVLVLVLPTDGFAADRVWNGSTSNVWSADNFTGGNTNAANGAVFYSDTPTFLNPTVTSNTSTAYMIFTANADSNMTFTIGNESGLRALRLASTISNSGAGSGELAVGNGAIIVDADAGGTFSIAADSLGQFVLGMNTNSGANTYLFTNNNSTSTFTISAPVWADRSENADTTRSMQIGGAGDWIFSGGIGQYAGNVTHPYTTPVSLIKSGSGTVTLSGSNTYTGTTSITQGTLILNGSISSASATTIAAGAILRGTGSITGAGTSASISGSLRPGTTGIGALTIERNVIWNSNDAWVFELGTAGADLASFGASDLLNLTGVGSDFLKGTGSTWTFDFAGTGAIGWYKLVDWTGTTDFLETDFSATGLASGLSGSFIVDTTSSALYLSVIPEPSSMALIGGLGMLMLLRRWTRHSNLNG